jgi:hypothetical protein
MSAGRIVLLVFGIIVVLISFGLIISGGTLLAVDSTFRDSQGYYTTPFAPVTANSSAIATHPADFHISRGFFMSNRDPASIRVEAQNNSSGKAIFIGIAREPDLTNYLNNVSHDEFTGLSLRPYHLELTHFAGGSPSTPPTTRTFWVASVTGTGTQTLQWDISSGTYSLVIMNADGSAPIDAQVSLAAKVPEVVRGVGWGLLIAGIIVLIIGGGLIFLAVRRRKA